MNLKICLIKIVKSKRAFTRISLPFHRKGLFFIISFQLKMSSELLRYFCKSLNRVDVRGNFHVMIVLTNDFLKYKMFVMHKFRCIYSYICYKHFILKLSNSTTKRNYGPSCLKRITNILTFSFTQTISPNSANWSRIHMVV